MTSHRISVLHEYQRIGPGLGAAFPPSDFEVQILTFGDPREVFRSDVARDCLPVTRIARDTSFEQLLPLLPDGAQLVTNDEACSALCARLRAARGQPACLPADLRAYASKLSMKRKLADASLPVPRFQRLEPGQGGMHAQLEAAARHCGLPLVVKPEAGGYNEGVAVLRSPLDLAAWAAQHADEPDWQAESFVEGALFHANAIVVDGVITPVQVGAYTSPPLGASHGQGLGSLTLPRHHPVHALGETLNANVIRTLGADGRFVVHTEFFVDERGRPRVVDVAARAPGALVSDIAALHSGVQLETASYLMQSARVPAAPRDTGVFAGWLWSPPRADGSVTSLLSWARDFSQLVRDLDLAASALGGERSLPWLRALL